MEATSMRLAPALAMLVAACGVEYPAPVVLEVQPDRGWNGSDTVVEIQGRNLYPQVWVEAGRQRDRVDAGFKAYLVDDESVEFELSGSLDDYDRFDAVVAPGLSPGVYDVVIESPSGRRGVLSDGFTVSDSIADRIVLDNLVPSAVVDTAIAVDVWLADPVGERVYEPGFGAVFWLEDQISGERLESVTFATSDISVQPPAGGGVLTGVLGENAQLDVTVREPGLYVLRAEAQRDTAVASDDVLLEWEAGVLDGIRIDLPSSPFVATVGEPFQVQLTWVDVFGNPVPGHFDDVILGSNCTGFIDQIGVLGSTPAQITLTTPCDGDELFDISDSERRSESFDVLPTTPDRLGVRVSSQQAVAGQFQEFQVVVEDAYGNPVAWTDDIDLSLDTGGLQGSGCTPSTFNIGEFDCWGTPTVAGVGVVLSASSAGLTGDSSPFDVDPNSGSLGDLIVTPTALAVAGAPIPVKVEVVDSWGNLIDPSSWGAASDWSVTDDQGESSCVWLGLSSGGADFECTLFTADGSTLLADLLPEGASGSSVQFGVINGPLDRVEMTLPGGSVVEAGAPFTVVLSGFDAWDNSTDVLVDPLLELFDDSDSLTPATALLGVQGEVQLLVTITVAGSTVIHAGQGGVTLGQSDVLSVVPGPTESLRVTVTDAPWAWVGQPEDVRVESVDAQGNRTSWSGAVEVSSRFTASPTAAGVSVTNGVATLQWTWTGPALDEVLDAQGGGWVGSSSPIDVATDCGAAGPTAAVDFGGFPEAVACVDPISGLGGANASFSGSVAAADPITRYDLAVLGGGVVRSASSALAFDMPGTGIHALRALVVDSGGCGHEVSATGYAAPDDGHAVGPLFLLPVSTDITAGLDVTGVDLLGATDCSRDIAVGATVYVRTALGELTSTVPTGHGLAVTTDANGDAFFDLDATQVQAGGDASLRAWVDSGAAVGATDVQISGDDLRPTVWWQTPEGDELSTVSTLVVQMSEPITQSSLNAAALDITGPYGVSVTSRQLDTSRSEITLEVSPSIDGSAGAWTLTIPKTLRDAQGNILSGDWSGLAADYTGVFGDVGTVVDPTVCMGTVPASATFRPDGDDGLDEQADALEISIEAAVAPAWWELTVESSVDATPIRVERLVPVAAAEVLVWDGRDGSGRVVDNGIYDVRITPVDGVGNRGSACEVAVEVENAFGDWP